MSLSLPQVTEIERRLHVVFETAQERVIYLEQFTARWTRFKSQLGELRAWCQHAPSLLEQLAAPDMNPAERVKKAESLHSQLDEKTRLLGVLASEAKELLLGETFYHPCSVEYNHTQSLCPFKVLHHFTIHNFKK